MSLINEALKRTQEELKRRNSMPYPFDIATNPSKELYQKSKKPFLFFLCSGIFLGAVIILLLTLIIHPSPVLQFFDSQSTPPIHTRLATETPTAVPVLAATETLFNSAQTDDSYSQSIEEEAQLDSLQDSALYNTLTEMISKMVAQQAASNTSSEEEDHIFSQKELSTIQVAQNITKPQETKADLADQLQESKSTFSQQNPIETFLSKLRITGIMFSGSESKVIIDNRIHCLQSKISDDPDLRLSEVNPHELVFTDPNGAVYKKKI